MFEHLPVITGDSVEAFKTAEFPELEARIGWTDFRGDMNALCQELDRERPVLGRVVRALAEELVRAVENRMQKEPEPVVNARWMVIAGILAQMELLRVVDRGLEAQELATQFKL